jgi:hypothetical protein
MKRQQDLLRFEQTEKQIAKEMALYGNAEADKPLDLIQLNSKMSYNEAVDLIHSHILDLDV